MDNNKQPQPGGYTPYGFNTGSNAYTPNFPPSGGYPPPSPHGPHQQQPQQPQPGGYSPHNNAVSIAKIVNRSSDKIFYR